MLHVCKPLWSLDQFEPEISTLTMDVHVNQLHKGYVDKLNKRFGESGLLNISPSSVLSDPDAYLTSADKQFYIDQMGGNVAHTMFWKSISPNRRQNTSKFLETYGLTHEDVVKAVLDEGLKRFGSGWVWGAISRDRRLTIYSTKNHDTPYMRKQKPIFCVDVWEHAYFIDRFGNREAWLKNVCGRLDYNNIDKFFEATQSDTDLLDQLVLRVR